MSEGERRYPRLNCSVNVQWEKPGGAPHTSSSRDISAGGIRMRLKAGVEVGEVLDLHLQLGERTVHCKGRVKWIDVIELADFEEGLGMEGGLEFVDMDMETRDLILRFIQDANAGHSGYY